MKDEEDQRNELEKALDRYQHREDVRSICYAYDDFDIRSNDFDDRTNENAYLCTTILIVFQYSLNVLFVDENDDI